MPVRALRFLACVFCSVVPLHAGGKKEDKAVVSVHLETDPTDNPKMIFPVDAGGKNRFFRRMPEISVKDIEAFNPFPADDGQSFGAVFTLKEHAARRFAAITAANLNQWMITQVNGQPLDGFVIDQQVSDGKVVVWRNLTIIDVQKLDETFPRLGPDGKPVKKQKKKD